MLGKHPKPTQE